MFEYDSNLNFAENNSIDDFKIEPRMGVKGLWEFSSVNSLSLNLGFGFEKYLENSNLDTFKSTIDSDSELTFTVLIDNLTLQFYDRPAYLTDSTDASFVDSSGELQSSVSQYIRFNNEVGVRGFYDLNIVNLDFNITRVDEIPDSPEFSFRDKTEYNYQFRLVRELSSFLSVGVGGTRSKLEFEEDLLNSGKSWSVGPFIDWSPSEYLKFLGGITWVNNEFSRGGAIEDTSDGDSLNTNLEVRHLLNRYYTHRLSLSRRTNYGFISNLRKVTRAAYTFTYEFNEDIDLNGSISYEEGDESPGLFSEEYDRFTYSLRTGWALGPDLSISISGEYSDKDSKAINRSYERFRTGFQLSYDF